MTQKLHEIVAIRKGVKTRTYGLLTELFKQAQKSDLYNGMSRSFKPKDDDGETFPAEDKKVQLFANDVLKQAQRLRVPYFDIEATQEFANTRARADVVVEGVVIIKDAPVTLLMSLEKELTDLRTFVEAMPTLDPARDWTVDPNSAMYRAETAITHKTKKVQRPIVLYDAVVKDGQAIPAQTQLITEDVVTGHWHTTNLSGALTAPRKELLLERLDALRSAVKEARARANSIEVEQVKIGEAIFAWLYR